MKTIIVHHLITHNNYYKRIIKIYLLINYKISEKNLFESTNCTADIKLATLLVL